MDIYTDGACSGNPGPGGWGAVLRYGDQEKELYGGEAGETTNNRMELLAPIQALESLIRPVTVRLYTDSTYVRNGITKWMARWKRNGWLTTDRQPVKNVDLWQRLEAVAGRHTVEWHWVKGHAGHPENERADRLAVKGLHEARGIPLSFGATSAPPQTTPEKAVTTTAARRSGSTAPGARCSGVTRKGEPCPIVARPSGLCHVHDPAVQCGAVKPDGKRCAIATGGGRCPQHRSR